MRCGARESSERAESGGRREGECAARRPRRRGAGACEHATLTAAATSAGMRGAQRRQRNGQARAPMPSVAAGCEPEGASAACCGAAAGRRMQKRKRSCSTMQSWRSRRHRRRTSHLAAAPHTARAAPPLPRLGLRCVVCRCRSGQGQARRGRTRRRRANRMMARQRTSRAAPHGLAPAGAA
jgi:hypothetical protein